VILRNDPALRVLRRLRPWQRLVRTIPHFALVAALAALSGGPAAVADEPTAGAATASNSVILPIRPCGHLTSERLLSPTRVPVRFFSARLSNLRGAEYCHVLGEIGMDFYFDLRLPQSTYEGQYVQEGCGGFCGFLSPSVPLVADDCPAGAGNTLALAVDNEGHATTLNTDARWAANNTERRTIFGSTSEQQLADVTKALIADYYGRDPAYSYFDGCSDGGREALIEAQRYPHDFNGILAGAPANIFVEQIGEESSWNIRVNTGSGGREVLTSEKLSALHAAVVRACGQDRGYVLDPRTCNFSPSNIHATAGLPMLASPRRRFESRPCSTAAQATQLTIPLSRRRALRFRTLVVVLVRQTIERSGMAPRHNGLPVRHQPSPLHGVPDRSTELVFSVAIPVHFVGLPEVDGALRALRCKGS
jgi:Tannase and feruloyl esterase